MKNWLKTTIARLWPGSRKCPRCGKQHLARTRYCEACLEHSRQRMGKTYRRRLYNGLCVKCGTRRRDRRGRKTCSYCAAKAAELFQRRKARRAKQ